MLYDLLWSEEDSHSLQLVNTVYPFTARLMKRLLNQWDVDFHKNMKRVVANISKQKEKSFLIFYSDSWEGKRESKRVLQFRYGLRFR